MQQIYNIIGVPGVGKSTMASNLAEHYKYFGSNLGIISLDLFKDGLRFVLFERGYHFNELNYPDKIFLEPSKRLLNPQDAYLAAEMKGKLNELILELTKIELIVVTEGFYFPQNRLPIIFLQRDYAFLQNVHRERQIKRYGAFDEQKLESELEIVLRNQLILETYLNSCNKNEVIINPEIHNLPLVESKRSIDKSLMIDNTFYIDPRYIVNELFFRMGIELCYIPAFEKGVMHALKRTKIENIN